MLYRLFGSLGHARLTAIKSAFGLDIIQSTPLCQNKFGPQKSNLYPLVFSQKPMYYISTNIFLDTYFSQDITKIAEP